MGIAKRLERTTRDLADRTRSAVAGATDEPPRAAYARVLDGQHLWFALPAADGAPVLLDPASGAVLGDPSRPASTAETSDGRFLGARWVVDDVLAHHDGAELLLAAQRPDRTVGVLPPAPQDDPSPQDEDVLRLPATPDGRWRLVLAAGDDGLLRLRRSRRRPSALLVDLQASEEQLTLHLLLTDPGEDAARLVLVDKDGTVVADVAPLTGPAADGTRSVVVTVDLLPQGTAQHRLAVSTGGRELLVLRHPDDVRIPDATGVLMPHLLDASGDAVAARLVWAPAGFLRIKRRDESEGPR